MKEQITIRLFEDDTVPTTRDSGRYHPEPIKSWDVDTGVTIALTEENGGRVFGIIDKVDPQPREDDQGHRYRTATVWIQD
jgi:hypothetical protein